MCYDWSKGAEKHNPATAKPYIFLHLTQVQLFQVFIASNNIILEIKTWNRTTVEIKNIIEALIYLQCSIFSMQDVEVKSKPRVASSGRKWNSSCRIALGPVGTITLFFWANDFSFVDIASYMIENANRDSLLPKEILCFVLHFNSTPTKFFCPFLGS